MAGLASRLADRGHAVTLVTLGDGSGDRHELSPEVSRVDLDLLSNSTNLFSSLVNLTRRVKAIRRATRSIAPDVLLSFCDRTNVLAGLSAEPKSALVLSERSDPNHQTLPRAWRMLRKYAYQRSDKIVVQTDSAAKFFDQYTVPCAVIPSAVDPPPTISNRDVAAANQQIVSIGRLADEKRFDRLIAAFAIVHQQYPDWKLRIIGEGPCRSSLEAEVQRLRLNEVVSMPGWIQPVWEELAASTIFVLPSDYEGFPSVLLEAMASGVASIALKDQSGSRAIIQHDVNGMLVESSPESIAKAIRTLIDNVAIREQLADAGKTVAKQFSWESMVDQYETVLRSVVNSPNTLD